jgi:hypothetical protein
MKPENIDKLNKYRFVKNSRSYTPAPGYSLRDVYDVIVEEWEPNYHVDWHCNYCLMQMVEFAFQKMDELITTKNINFNT